jgi:6-phosphogluconate dehydrogenase
MIGGARRSFERLAPLFDALAARSADGPAAAYLGSDGAGHFVKMVHNGVEYAAMQAIAETCFVMRHLLALSPAEMADRCRRWNDETFDSHLLAVTADVLSRRDPASDRPLIDLVVDRAEQKGTGAWTVAAALDLGVATPTIAEAVFARALSADPARRQAAEASSPTADLGDREAMLGALRDGLHGALLVTYAQGLALLDAARRVYRWDFDLGVIGRIWQAGAIIRARLVDALARAARGRDAVDLWRNEEWLARLAAIDAGWRAALAAALRQRLPTPVLASALAYRDALAQPRLWTDLIQLQRDRFGRHGFSRIDRPGVFHLDAEAPDDEGA